MLVLAFNGGHDGAAAAIDDRRLLFSLESEKDSFVRHHRLHASTTLAAGELLGGVPDVVALSGWSKGHRLGRFEVGAGYFGANGIEHRDGTFQGRACTIFSGSHERSHIMMAVGMAPRDDATARAVLVWEGMIGRFYILDQDFAVTRQVQVMTQPGNRFSFLFALADQSFPDTGARLRMEDAGKLMALAAFGDSSEADEGIRDTVERIFAVRTFVPSAPKVEFRDSPIYNAGVESDAHKVAAALLSERIFARFAESARANLPSGVPLHISGGCGLNCDWNSQWRELGQFSSVFVPPVANDSGASIGTAIDALHFMTGDPYIEWDVYSGREFEWDIDREPSRWRRRRMEEVEVARALREGQVFAWVQGRWEIGPRALGNRSILAEPFNPATRERLNEIKEREGYRPIAPCCRAEDLELVFNQAFEDPYMLYFRTVRSDRFGAVTHIDGSARCQTVTAEGNAMLHRLLGTFAEETGFGVLCNTSLNFKGYGFINRMTDLVRYCDDTGIDAFVVGDSWFQKVEV